MRDEKLVGLLVGRENTFPQAFVDRVDSKRAGVRVEFAKLGGTRADEHIPYDVIIDRVSHQIPYYRAYLKKAVLDGAVAVNNPFWCSADDKFFQVCLAARLGVAVPRTVVLPQKSYVVGVGSDSLRNLLYPLDWQGIADYVGLPAFLKPFAGGGWKNVYNVHSVDELIWCFDQTGELGMILQEAIPHDKYARCLCVGQSNIRVMRYEPSKPFHLRYEADDAYFDDGLKARIIGDARTVVSSLGYDVDTVEFAIRDGVPYAIDWFNPAPDLDYYTLGAANFEWGVEAMANLAIERALTGFPRGLGPGHRWDQFLDSAPPPQGVPVADWTEFAPEEARAKKHSDLEAARRAASSIVHRHPSRPVQRGAGRAEPAVGQEPTGDGDAVGGATS